MSGRKPEAMIVKYFAEHRTLVRPILPIFLSALIAGSLGPSATLAQKSPNVSLTVSAAISLKDALDEVAKLYEQNHSGATLLYTYGGSGTLQHQIEQGAPVDIFFSAAEKQMDSLQTEHLIIPATRHDIVRNALVLVTPSDDDSIKDFADLTRTSVKTVALGEAATVPAGMYAKETLQHLGLFDAIQRKVVYAKDVRQVLAYVETANADAGIVYRTDALTTKKVRIAADAPADSHEPIVYPAAVVSATKSEAAAREFLEFLAGAEARAIFVKYGFSAAASH
jgi:molybdate transport system substrate-binding protein